MLVPVLIGLAFRSSPTSGRNIPGNQTKHPRLIALELKELLPEMDETIELAELYFNALEKKDSDSLDGLVSSITSDLRELRNLLTTSKTGGVLSLTLRIRGETEKIPMLLTNLMYHSRIPSYQKELALVRESYDALIQRDSLLGDILQFLRAYCITRWKGAEELTIKTASRVDDTLSK